MKKTTAILMTMMFFILLFGCDTGNIGLQVGFSADGAETSPGIWCGFTTDRSSLQVGEDLAIRLYYGTIYETEDELLDMIKINDILINDISVQISTFYGSYTKELLQKGELTYSNPEYTFEFRLEENILYRQITEDFVSENYPSAGIDSKYEEIIVPSSWFNNEMGAIGWSIDICGVSSDIFIKDNSIGTVVTLYYKVEDNKIIFYDSYYNFYNDIK